MKTLLTPVRKLFLLVLFLMLTASVSRLAAQVPQAQVTISLKTLPQENQNKLRGLDRIIQTYINQRDWAPNDYLYTLPIDLEIHFEEASAVSFEDRYKARIVVSNRDNMQYNDRRWQFPLEPGVRLTYSEQFEPFRSMIDYYMFMALGHEFDKVKKFGGTPYFELARRISQQAQFSSRYFLGWDKREEWVKAVLKPEMETSRYLNFLYYTGDWLYYTERDRKSAKQYLLYATRLFERVPPEQLKRFFDLNYYRYANALAEYGEFKTIEKLASIDPNPEHAILYGRLLEKR